MTETLSPREALLASLEGLRQREEALSEEIEALKEEARRLKPANCHIKWVSGKAYVYRSTRRGKQVSTEYLGAITPRWGRPVPKHILRELRLKKEKREQLVALLLKIKELTEQKKALRKQRKKTEAALRKLLNGNDTQ